MALPAYRTSSAMVPGATPPAVPGSSAPLATLKSCARRAATGSVDEFLRLAGAGARRPRPGPGLRQVGLDSTKNALIAGPFGGMPIKRGSFDGEVHLSEGRPRRLLRAAGRAGVRTAASAGAVVVRSASFASNICRCHSHTARVAPASYRSQSVTGASFSNFPRI